MSVIEAIILGLIQGLTEFIPISSSGHLVLAQNFFNGASDHLFLEWINLGTVLALIIFFWPKIIQIIRDILNKKDWRLAQNVLIAILPAGLIGFLLADFIENTAFFGSVLTVAISLAAVGVVMIVLERLPKLSNVKTESELPPKRAFYIGLAQVLALIPGVSRSGSTIITGRLSGLSNAAAAEFSFLISIPIMLGVLAKLILKSSDRAYFFDNLSPILISNLAALIAGLIAVSFLMNYLKKHSLKVFGWYRVVLAAVILLTLLVQ